MKTNTQLRLKGTDGDEVSFKVKKETKMSKIMTAYAKQKDIALSTIRFMLDGKRIHADETPKMLELEDDDQIDVLAEQQGGGSLH